SPFPTRRSSALSLLSAAVRAGHRADRRLACVRATGAWLVRPGCDRHHRASLLRAPIQYWIRVHLRPLVRRPWSLLVAGVPRHPPPKEVWITARIAAGCLWVNVAEPEA